MKGVFILAIFTVLYIIQSVNGECWQPKDCVYGRTQGKSREEKCRVLYNYRECLEYRGCFYGEYLDNYNTYYYSLDVVCGGSVVTISASLLMVSTLITAWIS
ncbi:hypothetical protein SNE40_016109 [Patella caerulea]|uniref:Sperm protein n=1 Tax=Patella caerulea TaxID=87958 RepID=A0AAN8PBK4_PATCE